MGNGPSCQIRVLIYSKSDNEIINKNKSGTMGIMMTDGVVESHHNRK
jgi:hypothetical protein